MIFQELFPAVRCIFFRASCLAQKKDAAAIRARDFRWFDCLIIRWFDGSDLPQIRRDTKGLFYILDEIIKNLSILTIAAAQNKKPNNRLTK